MPDGRTELYAIWKSCERFNILPPGVERVWDDNDPFVQALLLAYDQIRTIETQELQIKLAQLGMRV